MSLGSVSTRLYITHHSASILSIDSNNICYYFSNAEIFNEACLYFCNKEVKQDIDSSSSKVDIGSLAPHDAAGLLKLYLRELPGSLLTLERVDAFKQVHGKIRKI